MNMPPGLLPLPSLLNEESFCRFSTRGEFVSAVKRLVGVVKKMRQYGFAAQMGCSKAVLSRVCYDAVTFREWLCLPNGPDVGENDVRRYVRQSISKVPHLEEWYATFYESPDFDLFWKDRKIYVNPERTLPAFVVAVRFNLPTVALCSEEFARSPTQDLVVRELDGEEIREHAVSVCSFADLSQVEAGDAYLQKLIKNAVVDEECFERVRREMFPDLAFSHQVEADLARHLICFRSIPVLTALIRMQRAFARFCSEDISFEEAYGRIKSLAMNESATVRQSCPDTRRFTWDDGVRQCYPHVKIGNCFRIHFLPDKVAGKLYVGYMGHHLPL